jgi:peptidylprolyl isomerase
LIESWKKTTFFDITIAGKNAKRIIIYVFADSKLNAVENFRALCSGKKGVGKK